jgi:hypothetical protein
MARRRQTIGGDDDEDSFIKAYFANQQQQQYDPRMEMAMKLLGFQERQQTAREKQALDERQQAALEKYQAGQLGIEQLRQKTSEAEAKSLSEARTAETSGKIQARMDEAQKEASRREEAAATLAANKEAKDRETAEKLMKDMLEHGDLKKTDPEYDLLQERASPGITEEKKKLKEGLFNRQVSEGLAKYQGADAATRKALAANPATLGGPDVYAEILKQAGVQTPSGTAVPESETIGGVGNWLWNAPGALQNVGKGTANLAARAALGANAPQVPYTEFTPLSAQAIAPPIDARDYSKFPGSVEDLIAASGRSTPPPQPPTPDISSPIIGGLPVPYGADIVGEMLRRIRGRGEVGSSMPPIPPQGVFQPFPG